MTLSLKILSGMDLVKCFLIFRALFLTERFQIWDFKVPRYGLQVCFQSRKGYSLATVEPLFV